MNFPRSSRGGRWLALTVAFVVAAVGFAAAQVNMQLSGVVESVGDHSLTLLTAAPPRRAGADPNAPPPPRPKLEVDLNEVPASQWVFLQPGERIAVVGLLSADGRSFAAIRIIGGAGPPRSPEAP